MECWIQITSGRGLAECSWVVHHIIPIFSKEAKARDLHVDVLEVINGDSPQTVKSVLLSLTGKNVLAFLKTWEGTIQWIGQSPFRPHHKRKNWFIGINPFIPPEEERFSHRDLKFETMKASGPGGQHVNKSNTAVRVTHLPSQLVATAQEERSQYMNKKLALVRLFQLIEKRQSAIEDKAQQEQWERHNELERGNSVRVFLGPKFKPKCHRLY